MKKVFLYLGIFATLIFILFGSGAACSQGCTNDSDCSGYPCAFCDISTGACQKMSEGEVCGNAGCMTCDSVRQCKVPASSDKRCPIETGDQSLGCGLCIDGGCSIRDENNEPRVPDGTGCFNAGSVSGTCQDGTCVPN